MTKEQADHLNALIEACTVAREAIIASVMAASLDRHSKNLAAEVDARRALHDYIHELRSD